MLFSFIVPVAITFFILQYQKNQVKREIKWKMIEGIDREKLVLLKFNEEEKQNQLKWEHSKEFEYKGEMYDIVEIEVKGDTFFYWCWWDYEETSLNKQLVELVSYALENNPKNQENQKRLSKFFESLFFSEPIEKITIALKKINNKYTYDQNFYQSVSNSPPIPPP